MPSLLYHIIPAFVAMSIMAGEAFSRQVTYQADQEASSLWIEGRSNINEFECISEKYSGYASARSLQTETFTENYFHGDVTLNVRIQVNGFECGRSRMNRDLQQALKADEHPEIIFNFGSAAIDESPVKAGDPFLLDVRGSLTAAGETREIQFEAKGYYLDNDRLRARGSSVIKMSDFKIDPPTALLGLVQADDELRVHFDLTAMRLSEAPN